MSSSAFPSSRATPQAVFLFDLIQDINVLRPIVRVLSADTRLELLFLASENLTRRDRTGVWRAELEELALISGARNETFASPLDARRWLQGRSGLIFSASESDLPAHEVNHDVFRGAPAIYVRITVQHGHECVGFRQNLEQTLYHGSEIRFAADILCGWGPVDSMTHLCASERPKYFELGPPVKLDRLFNRPKVRTGEQIGLVCENLHSVRMRTTGDFQSAYIELIRNFATSQASAGRGIALRPHPGGQFTVKNAVSLPPNVQLANAAMYKTHLQKFSYGISAPSSVLIDLVLAGIPTAVWCDQDGIIDTSGYEGLTKVSSLADWIAFADEAVANPEPFLRRQQEFLTCNGLDVAPDIIRERLLKLVDGATLSLRPEDIPLRRATRLLLVANGIVPTLEISFLKPLQALVDDGLVKIKILTESEIRTLGASAGSMSLAVEEAERFAPDLVVFCRYSGPAAADIVERLRRSRVPIIFHIDDDLLNVPAEIGPKYFEHNKPERTESIRYLLENADLVYCSTRRLRERFIELGFARDLDVGAIYTSGDVIREAEPLPVTTIGFMGNDKTPELDDLVPVIASILERNPQVRFELFGSMQMPEALTRFDERVSSIPRVSDYNAFSKKFRELKWDIGLAPLRPSPFNLVKADTKWVDYTSIGTAVVASSGTAYDNCCADGCGLLTGEPEEWVNAIQALIDDPQRRYAMVAAAQSKLRSDYSLRRLTVQVLEKFESASRRALGRLVEDDCVEP